MNKVFKVIWSEARNAYVVVSEIAKNHGSKSCSTKKLLTMLIATGVMTCASMAPAMAATNVDSNANVTVKKGATVTVAENATVTVGDNAIVLGKGASAVKDSVAIGSGASVVAGNNGSSGVALGNKAHAGYKGTSLGSSAISGREGTTVVGTDSVINSDGTSYTALGRSINVQGAAATVVGSKNTVDNKNGKVYSGVANNVMGSANTIEASNGVTIQGIGNKVTDAYKDMNISIWEAYTIGKGDYSALAKKESGAVAVVGGANTVSKQTDSTVIGYDKKLTGDKEKGSQNVFMAGSHNELNNVSDSLVMGNKNAITGVSNVISFGYQNAITANNAVAIGNGASVSVEGGVALGVGSVADRANAVSVGSKGAERQIINVKEGVEDTDAVNVSQLKDVKAEALKHTTVTDGANITVTEGLNEDGGKKYKVALNNDILLSGDNDAFVNISGSKGTIWTSGSVAAGNVVMDGATATVSGLGNTTTAYDGFANGKGKAATEEQLKEVATEAGKHTTVTDGANITVTEGLNEDGGKKYKVALNNDILLSGDNDAFVNISGSKGTIWTSGSVAAGNVVMDGATATVSGLGNTTTAYDGFANGKGKAATEEQLKEISKVADNANQGWNLSTNGDAASKVAPGETVDFSGDKNISVSNNGKDVKVELNKDIDVNSVQTNALNAKYNLSVGTANENGTVPFFVNSNGAFYAANGKLVVDKDGKLVAPEAELGKVTADEGVIGNVVLKDGVFYKNSALRDGELFIGDADGNYSQITPKSAKLGQVTIDEKGNIAGANHIQTNALNAKYNLSVGTANENGTVPFFVNSNGAFYAANGKLVVDKDGKLVAPEAELGKVTADEGVIGNVVLKDGVFYKNSALRDGELFIGDADGNYSQITTKGAKLGKVTVAADGKISGVAAGAITADSTDAVNGSQLHAVATEAGKHSKVVNGSNINVEETDVDGQKIYKVNLNKDIMLGDLTGKYVNISGTNGTIETTGYIATKDRVYADKGAKLADIDVTGDKISNGASSIVLDGSNVKVNDKVTIDQNGNIAGVNSIQTNALNAKYNLSVGTANENGTVPFFVNSNGAFYAANGKLVVDKDGKLVAPEAELGKVTADEGVIGNVVLKDGVFYKNSALRDGELFIGYADGNYSQITTKGAKLGKVTVAEDGKISGVAAGAITADSTDAVNGSQLHAVATEAGKHSKVVNGSNINVEETDVDGQKIYKVNLNKDIMLGDLTGKYVNISGTNGTIETTGYIATKDRVYADKGAKLADIDVTGDKISNGASSIVLDGSNVKVNDKVTIDQNGNIAGVNSIQTNALNAKYNLSVGTANENGIMPFFVNSNGAFYGANNNFSVDKDGKVTATAGEIGNVVLDNGVFTGHSALRDGELFVGDASGNYSQITTKGAKLGKVTVAEDGKISGVAAGAITADSTDAVNGSQLHAVATEAGKHSKVVNGSNINVEETDVDGQKIYKVNLNKDIMLGDLTGKYVNISGTNGTIETTGYIATKDRVYADKGAKLADIDVTGDKISNGASSIVLDGSNVKVNDKVTIDQNGNIAGVNSIQTNALNAKYNLSVGTANENGIMPFFVNSNGAFYGANNNFSVDKDGKVTATAGEIGNVVLDNGVFTGHSALRDGELFVGDASGNYSQITTKGAKLGKVTVAEDGKISGVAAGAITADSTDAVNGSQLHAVATEAGKHSKVVNGSNINVEETDVDGQKIYKVNLNKDIMLGDLTGKYVNISGTNGTIETTGYIATKDRVYADKGGKLADIDVTGNKISNGASSIVLDGSNVKVNDKVTIDQNGKISGVAAGEVSSTSTDAINGSQLYQTNENVAQNKADIAQNKADIAQNKADIAQNKADIAQNKADIAQNKADIATNKADIAQNKADIAQNKTDIKNLDNRVTNVEELAKKHTTVTAGDNITVAETTNADGGKEYKVALNKDISVDSVKAGDTTITDKGLEIKDGPSVTKDGINAGNKKITGVAKGEADTDAVNYGQLKETNNHIDRVENQVVSNTNRINQLGSRVNKVGAGAAALAALHPMDFDPDDKLTFSAGYGNYGGENAAAIGAYYRPDEKVMFSVGGTVGNGENMVNAGVSFSLDRTNHVSNSRTAMAREILDLRAEVTELKAMVAKGGLGSIAEDKMKIFPDVAENHWAYEYVGKLAAAGIIEGYPDGKFSGDRMMSRYEFAAMLYRAMQKGAQLDSKIINEFAPEMGRIRVDRISGEDGDRDKIERVRVNAVKGERDHYGNKIAKAEAKAK